MCVCLCRESKFGPDTHGWCTTHFVVSRTEFPWPALAQLPLTLQVVVDRQLQGVTTEAWVTRLELEALPLPCPFPCS